MTNFKKLYRQQNFRALALLLLWAGSPAELARVARVNRSTVTRWQSEGKVSKDGALAISQFTGCPLTREEIRPDIKVWT
jgi:DNA-binding transcriptional regulator YdaS (Cro superfamily)